MRANAALSRLAKPALAGLLLALAPLASAEVTPLAGPGDPHIQTVAFDPQQVVALHVAPGFAVTVRFAPDERIETVTLGDAAAWSVQVNHRADNLVVKPNGLAAPTNLTVMTDQRAYSFALYGASAGLGVQPYLVSFTYPTPPGEPASATPLAAGHYRLKGDKALWPEAISDDGQATAIRWTGEAEMPAVYSEDEPGRIALVNGLMRDGAYVIDSVHSRLVFIRGKARATALHQSREQRP